MMLMPITQSAFYLAFLENHGFSLQKYPKFLELSQSAPLSISQFFAKQNPYLLSEKVDYHELEALQLHGAQGKLTQKGIYVNKNFEDLENVGSIMERRTFPIPSMNEFDAIISTDYSLDTINAAYYPHDKFCGLILESNSDNKANTKASMDYLHFLKEIFSSITSDNYTIIHDSMREYDSDFYLVKKK